MNRGIARRTIFESRADVRYFLSRIAWTVKRGMLEVHAYCVMTTHFHLLVRSPRGELSNAMQWVQDLYARWYNRRRKRDGSLFRGRYCSRIVDSDEYFETLIRYIDANAVSARVVSDGALYPFGSAFHYSQEHGPPWLCRTSIEAVVKRCCGGTGDYNPYDYLRVFGSAPPESVLRLIERRLHGPSEGPDPLNDLIRASPERVRAWMVRKAKLADGKSATQPVASHETVLSLLRHQSRLDPEWEPDLGRRRPGAWDLMEAGLLRTICALTLREIAELTSTSVSGASLQVKAHRRALVEGHEYGARAASIAREAVRRDFNR